MSNSQTTNSVLKMGILSRKLEIETSDDDDVDCDTVNPETLHTLFNKANLIFEKSVDDDTYVLHLTGTIEAQPTLAAALSNHAVHVLKFENDQLCDDAVLREHKDVVVGVKFCPDNQQNILTASNEGVVKLWDLRLPQKSVLEFTDTTREEESVVKPFTCFDVSPNGRLLVAGTELCDGDAFLLFWDVRNTKLLGGYWESHTDDVTQLRFHLDDSNKLISGSTDGLMNLYDLSQPCEDDALVETFNTESSVSTIAWYTANQSDAVACTTHTHDLQLWNIEGVEPYASFDREKISAAMKRSSETHTYLDQVLVHNNGLLVVAGSTYGNGECARTLFVQSRALQPAFDLEGNKQIIRSSWCNPHINLLATGGENGVINVWKINGR